MISQQSRTTEWVMKIRETSPGRDPILIEKMILALTLVEQLRQSGLEFIFKGGTSLLLLLGTPNRFSIDIDIILDEEKILNDYFSNVIQKGVFHKFEKNPRESGIPKQHYKFFYNSFIQEKESHILLDILFEKNPYPCLQTIKMDVPLLLTEGAPTQVVCPTIECLLGDKLTAFAPHSTGILYGKGKELEIIKQLFDIGILFDATQDVNVIKTTFESFAARELGYRGLSHLTPDDVLLDIFKTACLIGMRDNQSGEYIELQNGIKKLGAFVYSGYFTLDTAILCASKAAYLAMLLRNDQGRFNRFDKKMNLSSVNISNLDYNKLNKIKKISPAAFYYFHQALELF